MKKITRLFALAACAAVLLTGCGGAADIAALPQPVAFVLWGGHAQKKAAIAAGSPYPRLVLQAPHPSPLSAYRGFFGCRHFSQTNRFLEEHGVEPIDWQIENI